MNYLDWSSPPLCKYCSFPKSSMFIGRPIKNTYVDTSNISFASILKKGIPKSISLAQSKPALLLDDSYILDSDFNKDLMGKVKGVFDILNLPFLLSKEGYPNVKNTYLGGANVVHSKHERFGTIFNIVDRWDGEPVIVEILMKFIWNTRGSIPYSIFKVNNVEQEVSYHEIKSTVWECSTNKSLGPDGFTFELFRLKINLHKSKFIGVGINIRNVENAACLIGCITFSTTFNYLGVKVGDDMSKIKSWDETAKEKKTRKIDRLARSLLIQGLPNDIYSLIDSNETAKDLWDALERQMRGSEYGKQDRKAVILYEYETFKANEGELLLDTYLCYLQVINDLKKCGYKKDNLLAPSQSALFPTSYFSPFIIPKDFYTNLVGIPG
nr:RNA-directed DNA polymerase, eukaryota, nucleotide-binding alpha-beta plait domain protein [Tanacetum cinerariifolium]